MRNILMMLFVSTALLVGCGESDKEVVVSPRSLSDLMASLTSDTEEFTFCLSEDAGIESLKQCGESLKSTVAELPDFVMSSELSESQKQSLSGEIEKLKSACDALVNSVGNNESGKKMSKANKAIADHVERICKQHSIK